MSNRTNLIRRSVCATCLSQGRALFPVSLEMLRYGFSVHEHDRVCWECRHFVSKIKAFNDRALRAQAVIKDWCKRKLRKVDLESLSSLGESTGLIIDIMDTPADKDMTFNIELVKEEPETDDEANEAVAGDGAISDDDEAWGDEAAPKKRSETGRKRKAHNTTEHFYTKKKMNEEEMMEWRERKKCSYYYTSCIPIYRCEKCIEGFDSQVSLDSHMKKHSEEYGTISCHICEQRCHDEVAMALHKKTHYRLFTCRLCGHEWDNANVMREHGEQAHKVPITGFQCDLCLKEYTRSYALSRHYKSHVRAPCQDCGAQVSDMKLHVHFNCRKQVEKMRCDACGKDYRGGAKGLGMHMRTHEDKEVDEVDEETFCVPCGVQFRSMNSYTKHISSSSKHLPDQSPKTYQCDECKKTFPNKRLLTHHIKYHHGATHKCPTCGKVVTSIIKLRKHINSAHRGTSPPRDKVCEYCGKAFTTKKILQQHINTHTGARPFACTLCDATFGFHSALYLHGRFKHGINQNRREKLPTAKRDTSEHSDSQQ